MDELQGSHPKYRSGKGTLFWLVLPLLMAWITLGACGGQNHIFLFAASSLTNVMERLGEEYEVEAGLKVKFNFGASRSLAQQIVRGAPADAFVAAGVQPMDLLESKGELAPGTRRVILTNTLSLVVSNGHDKKIVSLQDVVDGGHRLAIADPELAPAGQYARDALVNLGFWSGLKDRLVYGANVRSTLGYVESGNVVAALVYSTDAAVGRGIHIVAVIPTSSHTPIHYPGAVMKESEKQDLAMGFLDFLGSERASAIFAKFGFTPVISP